MNAKEMFEKLGYKLVEDIWNNNLFRYKYIQYELVFDLIEKTYAFIQTDDDYYGYASVDLDFHQAITQQMKELGWIDD